MNVFSIPLRTRFRGITVREGVPAWTARRFACRAELGFCACGRRAAAVCALRRPALDGDGFVALAGFAGEVDGTRTETVWWPWPIAAPRGGAGALWTWETNGRDGT